MTNKERTANILELFRTYDRKTAKKQEEKKLVKILLMVRDLDEEQEEGAKDE